MKKKCVCDSGFCGVIAAGMVKMIQSLNGSMAQSRNGMQHLKKIKVTEEKVMALWDGSRARCGNCHGVLGDFSKADGEIKCRKNDCKAVNVVRKP